jgi:hypothetical protein
VKHDVPRQQEAHGQRDADEVVNSGPHEVQADLPEDAAGQVDGGDDVEQVVAHEDDVGRFHRNVGAGAEGNTDVGGCQRWRVVDTVADLSYG